MSSLSDNVYIQVRLLILLFLFSLPLFSITTSVVIPCYYRHFRFIPFLLETLEKQSTLPDEVVIALSEASKVDPDLLEQVKKAHFPFILQLIEIEEKQLAGENRNRGVTHSTMDLVIFQDADDIPHPQRIEIIKEAFFSHNLVCLRHGFSYEGDDLNIVYEFDEFPFQERVDNAFMCDGPLAILRKVATQFPSFPIAQGEDTAYFWRLKRLFSSRVKELPLKLYLWQYEHSSWQYQDQQEAYLLDKS